MSKYDLFPLEEIEGLEEDISRNANTFCLTASGDVVLSNADVIEYVIRKYGDRCIINRRNSSHADNLDLFNKTWRAWKRQETVNFEKIYTALMTDYEPLENYNSTEIHSGMDVTDYNGTETNATSGTDTTAYKGIEKNSHNGLNKDGEQGNVATRKIGAEETENSVNGYNSETYKNADRSTVTFKSDGSTSVDYNSVKVEDADSSGRGGSIEFQSGATQGGRSDIEKHNTISSHLFNEVNERSFTDRTDEVTHGMSSTKSFTDRNDSISFGHEIRKRGNIGVTTSQQMLQSEIDLRRYSIIDDFMTRFINYATVYAE